MLFVPLFGLGAKIRKKCNANNQKLKKASEINSLNVLEFHFLVGFEFALEIPHFAYLKKILNTPAFGLWKVGSFC